RYALASFPTRRSSDLLELIVETAARASSMNSIGRQRPPIAIGRNRCCEDSPGPDARHWTGAAPFARTKLENYEPATDNAQAPNQDRKSTRLNSSHVSS